MCGGPQTFWRSGAAEQVASVRATLVAAISTSFTALPQIALQAYVYGAGDVALSAYAERLVFFSSGVTPFAVSSADPRPPG